MGVFQPFMPAYSG